MKINSLSIIFCLGLAMEADPLSASAEQVLKFRASVPEEDFTITPFRPWPTETIEIARNAATDKFESYVMPISILSKTYNVKLKLESDAILVSETNKDASILMYVTVDGNAIDTRGRRVHDRNPAELRHQLIFRAQYPPSSYSAGAYSGSIVLVFDSD